MKTKNVEYKKGGLTIIFEKKYYILEGNNGNHNKYNRIWTVLSDGYNTKKEASKAYKSFVNEDGDIKFGLTPLMICNVPEIIEIIEGESRINLNRCFDIKII